MARDDAHEPSPKMPHANEAGNVAGQGRGSCNNHAVDARPSTQQRRRGDEEMEKSNATMNKFLGSKRHAWMTGPQSSPATGPPRVAAVGGISQPEHLSSMNSSRKVVDPLVNYTVPPAPLDPIRTVVRAQENMPVASGQPVDRSFGGSTQGPDASRIQPLQAAASLPHHQTINSPDKVLNPPRKACQKRAAGKLSFLTNDSSSFSGDIHASTSLQPSLGQNRVPVRRTADGSQMLSTSPESSALDPIRDVCGIAQIATASSQDPSIMSGSPNLPASPRPPNPVLDDRLQHLATNLPFAEHPTNMRAVSSGLHSPPEPVSISKHTHGNDPSTVPLENELTHRTATNYSPTLVANPMGLDRENSGSRSASTAERESQVVNLTGPLVTSQRPNGGVRDASGSVSSVHQPIATATASNKSSSATQAQPLPAVSSIHTQASISPTDSAQSQYSNIQQDNIQYLNTPLASRRSNYVSPYQPQPSSASNSLQQRGIPQLPPAHHEPQKNHGPSQAHTPPKQAMPMFDTVEGLRRIAAFEFPNGRDQPQRMLNGQEAGRLTLLRMALEQGDDLYIHIHQLFCQAHVDFHMLDPAVKALNNLDTAFRVLETLIMSNTGLSMASLNWFSSAKFAINSSTNFPELYKANMDQFITFVTRSSQNWNQYKDTCLTRNVIPLVQDIETYLGISSPILQVVVFNSILRELWRPRIEGPQNPWVQCADRLFRKNQYDWNLFKRSWQSLGNPLIPLQSMNQYAQWFNERYTALYRAYKEIDPPSIASTMDFENSPINFLVWSVSNRHLSQSPSVTSSNGTTSSHASGHVQQHGTTGATYVQQRPRPNSTVSSNFSVAPTINTHIAHQQHQTLPLTPSPSISTPTSITSPRSAQSHAAGPQLNQIPPIVSQQRVTLRPCQNFVQVQSQMQQRPPAMRDHPPPTPQKSPQRRRLLPPDTFQRRQERVPNPSRSSIHLLHLRSPYMRSASLEDAQERPELFQLVMYLALLPFTIGTESRLPFVETSFQVSKDVFTRIPRDIRSDRRGELPSRIITIESVQFRLRCCKLEPQEAAVFVNTTGNYIDDSNWVAKDTSWPDGLFLKLNNQPLELRRKLHFGRDKPIDISPFVKEGTNNLNVFVNIAPLRDGQPDAPWPKGYYFAIEAVGAMSKANILMLAHTDTNKISAYDTLNRIKAALNPQTATPAHDDDDDICIVSSTITIDVTDPLLHAQIPGTPVRGRNCKHRECFDLDLFLSSRTPMGRKENVPSAVDVWKCPVCKLDVRPGNLHRDEFMERVLKSLRSVEGGRGKDVTKIFVEQDGTWKAKTEDGCEIVGKMFEGRTELNGNNNGGQQEKTIGRGMNEVRIHGAQEPASAAGAEAAVPEPIPVVPARRPLSTVSITSTSSGTTSDDEHIVVEPRGSDGGAKIAGVSTSSEPWVNIHGLRSSTNGADRGHSTASLEKRRRKSIDAGVQAGKRTKVDVNENAS